MSRYYKSCTQSNPSIVVTTCRKRDPYRRERVRTGGNGFGRAEKPIRNTKAKTLEKKGGSLILSKLSREGNKKPRQFPVIGPKKWVFSRVANVFFI